MVNRVGPQYLLDIPARLLDRDALDKDIKIARRRFAHPLAKASLTPIIRGYGEYHIIIKLVEQIAKVVVLLYNNIAKQIIKLLLQHPEYTLMEIAENIIPPVFHGTVQYHLKKFEDVGLVIKDGDYRRVNTELLKKYNSLVCQELQII